MPKTGDCHKSGHTHYHCRWHWSSPRAITSGGKVEYQRFETSGPKMQIGYTEHIDHKPADGGPPKSVGHAKIICFK
tara:strand:+ start:2746 stop:2973 length:228 start_codon:yes stop_codon:yes gene_type:complete